MAYQSTFLARVCVCDYERNKIGYFEASLALP